MELKSRGHPNSANAGPGGPISEEPAVFYLSLDIEASGPFPGLFSLVSVGAVPVRRLEGRGAWTPDEEDTFYVEFQPLEGAGEVPAATKVHGLTTEYLQEHGKPPLVGLTEYAAYVQRLQKRWGRALAAGWPASFDAPFIGWYCQKYLGDNPLGYKSFDIGSYAQGLFRCDRKKVHYRLAEAGLWDSQNPYPHNALADAKKQAHLLAGLLNASEA